ncbi:MAG: hypothetical protein M1838_005956 [Thelocarpon superellum]|nr:MAG: hypothetical protein M1838_005956 [Thelocarpon superellum]
MDTPSFFSAALGAQEPNIFDASFKADMSGLDRANDMSDGTLTPGKFLRSVNNDSFSPLFRFSPGLSPLPFDLASRDRATEPSSRQMQSSSLRLNEVADRVWSDEAEATSRPEPPIIPQEPSPPHSSRSPPPASWAYPIPNTSTSSERYEPTYGTSGATGATRGQITPPSDTTPPTPVDLVETWTPEQAPGEKKDTAISTSPASKRKRGRQVNQPEQEPETSSTKRQRKSNTRSRAGGAGASNETSAKGEDQKRNRFLERNRVAASKCRQKKKEWTGNLEARARELQSERNQISVVVSSLRNEVVWLKGELLKHTTCGCERIRQYLDQEVAHLATQPGSLPAPSARALLSGTTSPSDSATRPESFGLLAGAQSPTTTTTLPPSLDPAVTCPIAQPSLSVTKTESDRQLYDTLSAEIAH